MGIRATSYACIHQLGFSVYLRRCVGSLIFHDHFASKSDGFWYPFSGLCSQFWLEDIKTLLTDGRNVGSCGSGLDISTGPNESACNSSLFWPMLITSGISLSSGACVILLRHWGGNRRLAHQQIVHRTRDGEERIV